MSVSRSVLMCARALAVFSLIVLVSTAVFAQSTAQTPPDAPQAQQRPANLPDYSRPRAMYTFYGPYAGRHVPPINLGNVHRVQDVMKDGKMMLSLSDAIVLALENNLDIAIARYNLSIADTDLLRTKGGGVNRGVSAGVVQGTPGGTGTAFSSGSSGTGAGGTTVSPGGAATGSGGIVASTAGVGPAVPQFDPAVTGTVQFERQESVCNYGAAICGGLSSIGANTTIADFTYTQGWATGTSANLAWNNGRTTTNSPFTSFNPNLNANFRLSMRQHLTQGFGLAVNRRFILTARNDRLITDAAFRQQIITTVTQIQDLYWDLVNAYENVRVQQEALSFAERTLSDNRKQVEIGTLAPIEIVHAQSQVATAQQQLIAAQTNLEYQQLLMKNAITRNMSDPKLATAPVIPTDTMHLTETAPADNLDELVAAALKNRPELDESRIDLQNRTITKKAARQALWPTLDVVGFYGGSGVTNLDYDSALYDAYTNRNPDRGVEFQLTIPIRNRVAQADQVRSELEYRQAEMRFQQQQNNIVIDVRFSHYALEQARAQVKAATAARDYALELMKAEQKKYELGASTTYLVLQLESSYVQAQSAFLAATTNYEKARVDLDRASGFTLEHLGIMVPEAMSGTVTHEPTVHEVAPRTDAPPAGTQPQK